MTPARAVRRHGRPGPLATRFDVAPGIRLVADAFGDPNGLRHNLRRNDSGRFVWHWDPEILTLARPLIEQQAQLSERLSTAVTRLRQPCLLVR